MQTYEDIEEESNLGVWGSVIHVLENYGWYILIFFIALTLFYQKTLKSYWEQFKQHRFEKEYAAKYHKNPDVFASHVNAQQAWAEKMQEKYRKESEIHAEKMREKEEKKKQALQEKYSSVCNVLGAKKDDKSSGLKPDYNPLMGGGGGSSYRPTRRSPCGGGGCGR